MGLFRVEGDKEKGGRNRIELHQIPLQHKLEQTTHKKHSCCCLRQQVSSTQMHSYTLESSLRLLQLKFIDIYV